MSWKERKQNPSDVKNRRKQRKNEKEGEMQNLSDSVVLDNHYGVVGSVLDLSREDSYTATKLSK